MTRNEDGEFDLPEAEEGEKGFSRGTIRVFQNLQSGDLAKMRRMADRLDQHGSDGTEKEMNYIYETFSVLVDQVLDLAHMVRRREEFMLNHGFDPSAYGEIALVAVKPE